MVPRSVTRNLTGLLLASVLACWSVDVAADGREALQRYREAAQQQQAAVGRQDAEAAQSHQVEATAALTEAMADFKAQYESSGNLEDALGYIETLRIHGDHDLAGKFAGRVIEAGEHNAAIYRVYGECLLATGPKTAQGGIDALYTALELDGTSSEALAAWNALGDYYLNHRMPEAATTAFNGALAIDENDVRAQLGLLVVDVFNGEIAAAGERLGAVGSKAQPYDTTLRQQLRIALADFDTHRRTFSDTAENHFAFARLMYSAARFPEAVQALLRAVTLAPQNTAMLNFLGSFQAQMGDYAGALKSFESSLQADSNQPVVRQSLESLRKSMGESGTPQPGQPMAPPQGQGPLR